jgi:DNA mismatch repair protein MutS
MSAVVSAARSQVPATAPFLSLLCRDVESLDALGSVQEPDYFHDLNLDQFVANMCGRQPWAGLQPLFWQPLPTADHVHYRQETMRECARPELQTGLREFVDGIRAVRIEQNLQAQVRYRLQKQRCLLDAAVRYCTTLAGLSKNLDDANVESDALRGLASFVTGYVNGTAFRELSADATRAHQAIDHVIYLVHVRASRIHVRRPEDEPDLGRRVADLFARFREDDQPPATAAFRGMGGFSHIDAAVLDKVAEVFTEEFSLLARFAERHAQFVDATIARVARETAFVIAWQDLAAELEARDLPLSLPEIVDEPAVTASHSYDIALATAARDLHVVHNDLAVTESARVVVVTGPNQGGKTTFARMFGQLHHLAAIGCPVPASQARVRLTDRVFVLFERREDPGTQRGKLMDDLVRMREIVDHATARSTVVLNEVFSSTATQDAVLLASRLLDVVLDRDCLAVVVTFLDELASYSPRVVSMVAEVDSHDPSRRTFRINVRPADGRAYAEAIATKYGLGRAAVADRVRVGKVPEATAGTGRGAR